MKKLFLIFLVLLIDRHEGKHTKKNELKKNEIILNLKAQETCTHLWDTNSYLNTNICPVITTTGDYCKFPFVYESITYYSCIINGPFNDNKIPRCMTMADQWADCKGTLTKKLSNKYIRFLFI